MPIHLPEGLMVSVSGVRGRVGESLTPELMTGISAAFGAHLRESRRGAVVLGRDSRRSRPHVFKSGYVGAAVCGMRRH